ncbi:purine nucleoside permease [Paraphaeosphaeria sporulosa]|uniref:Purine nucleoside permease n=1 Tax=Paraphaeosphaeria sporulosa TaxID=1460663 RepID=A0A177C881_9PLEO|nr:purine nucleoside permease [Paraphaeosphaeria sporulosa]OAG03341.1 purine nucleoside permease [Paraphaeosphaeria sporulosa]
MLNGVEEAWFRIPGFDIMARNITVTGFSPKFPDAHCTADGSICQIVTAMGGINAAITIKSLCLSPLFDLKSTYFIAGVGGINPALPANFSTGHVSQESYEPNVYPGDIYGTEAFDALRKVAAGFARTAALNDSAEAVAYRALYDTPKRIYKAETQPPSVFSRRLLGETFGNYTEVSTNGTGIYCKTAQEDNVTRKLCCVVTSPVCDMDRPYPGEPATTNLWWSNQDGYPPALRNLYLAGIKIIEGIVDDWNDAFAEGIMRQIT